MLAWTFPFFYLNMAPGSVDAVNLNSEQANNLKYKIKKCKRLN
jgi:hypothetical protein